MPKKPAPTLAELRAAAYAAVAAHDHDMKTDANYRAVVEKQDARRHAKAVKEGRNPLAVAAKLPKPGENEVTGDDLLAPRVLTVTIGRGSYPANSLAKASALYREYIERAGLGVRDTPACNVQEAGAYIALVTYNGRVWAL